MKAKSNLMAKSAKLFLLETKFDEFLAVVVVCAGENFNLKAQKQRFKPTCFMTLMLEFR